MMNPENPLETPESLWRVAEEIEEEVTELDSAVGWLLRAYLDNCSGLLVCAEGEGGLHVYAMEPEVLTKLPHPELDAKSIEISQLLASIYTLARESVGANLTDHKHFTLDEAKQEMLDCVERFFEGQEEGDGR